MVLLLITIVTGANINQLITGGPHIVRNVNPGLIYHGTIWVSNHDYWGNTPLIIFNKPWFINPGLTLHTQAILMFLVEAVLSQIMLALGYWENNGPGIPLAWQNLLTLLEESDFFMISEFAWWRMCLGFFKHRLPPKFHGWYIHIRHQNWPLGWFFWDAAGQLPIVLYP